MTQTILRSLPKFLVFVALAVAVLVMPMPHRAKAAHKASKHPMVDFQLDLHGLDIGIPQNQIFQELDRQEAADHPGIGIENGKDDSSAVQFLVDVNKQDDGAFGITDTVVGPPEIVDNGRDTESRVERDTKKILADILALERDLDRDIHDR